MTLNEWLAKPNRDGSKRRKNALAERIGVTPTMVTEYAEGRMWPGREIMKRIETATDGQVTANDMLHTEAAE